MRLNKQNKIIVGVLAFLLTLTVGYAVFSQSLNITGTAEASGNFSLIFSSVKSVNEYGSNGASAAIKESDKTLLEVSVPNLQYPSAYVDITAEIKNEGSVNALLKSITTEGLSDNDIKVTYKLLKDGKEINLEKEKDVIESGKTRDIVITVTWDKDSKKSKVTLDEFKIYLNYEQYTNSIVDNETTEENKCTTFTKKDTYEVGDVIAFCDEETGKSEDFYVISDNGTTVTALAKYNLLVGNMIDVSTSEVTLISTDDVNYGLQSSKTRFEINIETGEFISTTLYGTISFANADENHKKTDNSYFGYWTDMNGDLLEKYGSFYPANVYDENSNLYVPLQNYKTYLEGLNININEIRPITYYELENLGCEPYDCKTDEVIKNNRTWIYENSSYWTASAASYNDLWLVTLSGEFEDFNDETFLAPYYGLRPVIEINKSEL